MLNFGVPMVEANNNSNSSIFSSNTIYNLNPQVHIAAYVAESRTRCNIDDLMSPLSLRHLAWFPNINPETLFGGGTERSLI